MGWLARGKENFLKKVVSVIRRGLNEGAVTFEKSSRVTPFLFVYPFRSSERLLNWISDQEEMQRMNC